MGELRLEVREFQDLTRWRWVLSDELGGFIADHEVRLDAGCWQYEAFSDLLGYLDWHVAPDSRVDGEAKVVGEVGAWIGERVLGPLAGVLAERRPAAVRVIAPGAARALLFRPLELAHANGKPLAVQDVTLVMEPESGAAVGKGIPAGGRLRVLGLFSLPEGGQTLNLRRERQSLVELIRSIAADGKAADVRVLQYGVTRERLREVLEEAEGWDIIHISGHGAPGELLFEDVAGQPDRVTAEELAGMLDLARERVKLITVAACWSATLTVAEQRRLLDLPVPDAEPRTRSRNGTATEGGSDKGPADGRSSDEGPVGGRSPEGRSDGQSPEDGSPEDGALEGRSDGQSAEGGSSEGRSPEGGFAAGALATELTGRLDCAVLAMRYPVGDNFAIALTSKLYGLLAEKGQTLPRSVGITLAQLAGELPWPSLALATPALFGARAVGLTLKAPERSGPEEYDPVKLKMAGFPQQPERFVGRTGVMTRASAALAAGSGVPGVLLHGMPGGGKTACALELAYTHEHAFGALVWYKAPDEGMDIKGALTDFTLTLENNLPGFQMVHLLADPAKLTAFLPRLTELVEQRRLLIVIDNIESLLSEVGQWRDEQWGQVIGALSAHRGRGRLILTTRRRPQSTEASGLQTESVR